MNGEFHIDVLTHGWDQELTEFYNTPVTTGGNMDLQLFYPNGYWNGLAIMGGTHTVMALRHNGNKGLVGAVTMSSYVAYFGKEQVPYFYVSGLKLLDEYKGTHAAKHLFGAILNFSAIHPDHALYFSVFATNRKAITLFERGLHLLPNSRCISSLNTYIFKRLPDHTGEIEILPLDKVPRQRITDFMRDATAELDNLPDNWSSDRHDRPVPPEILPEHTTVALRNGKVVGLVGLRDTSAYRYWKVNRYGAGLRRLRNSINAIGKRLGYPELPPEHQNAGLLVLSSLLVKDQDPDVLRALLCGLQPVVEGHFAKANGMILTLPASSPLNRALTKRSVRFKSRYYFAAFPHCQHQHPPGLLQAPYFIETTQI